MTSQRSKSRTNGTNLGTNFARLQAQDATPSAPEESIMSLIALLFKGTVSVLFGVVFGVATEKARVFEPAVVTNQMLFHRFTMLKVFLSALTTGMFVLSILAILPITRTQYLEARRSFYSSLSRKGNFSVSLGAFILGCGMAVVGTCPGLVLVQLGAGVPNAVFTLLGVLLGAVLYGLVELYLTNLTKPSTPIQYPFLYQAIGSPPFVVSLPLFSIFGIAAFSLEIIDPFEAEAYEDKSMLSGQSWSPCLCGCLIGALQLPLVMTVGDTLGGSRGYCTIVSQGLVTRSLKKMSPYLAKVQKGIGNWWQVFFISGSFIGAYLSASSSGTYGTVAGASPIVSVLGGIMIIFGARFAGGCSSGHGLSGVGLLSTSSILAVLCMFCGGIVTANVIKLLS